MSDMAIFYSPSCWPFKMPEFNVISVVRVRSFSIERVGNWRFSLNLLPDREEEDCEALNFVALFVLDWDWTV